MTETVMQTTGETRGSDKANEHGGAAFLASVSHSEHSALNLNEHRYWAETAQ